MPLRLGVLGNLFKPPKVPGGDFIGELDSLASLGVRFTLNSLGDKSLERVEMRERFSRPWLDVESRVTHAEAVERMKKMDRLLLLLADLPNCHVIFHMKLVSYIQIGKPILAVLPANSFAASIVERYCAGVVVLPGPGLALRIKHALEKWEPDESVREISDRMSYRSIGFSMHGSGSLRIGLNSCVSSEAWTLPRSRLATGPHVRPDTRVNGHDHN